MLQADLSLRHPTVGDYFDGRTIATYIVSTGNFVHPVSRRALTLDECSALDAHLVKHKLAEAIVAYSYENRSEYLRPQPNQGIAQLREEATAVLHALFNNSRGRQQQAEGGSGRLRGGAARASQCDASAAVAADAARFRPDHQRGAAAAATNLPAAALARMQPQAAVGDGGLTVVDDDLLPPCNCARGAGCGSAAAAAATRRRRTPSRPAASGTGAPAN